MKKPSLKNNPKNKSTKQLSGSETAKTKPKVSGWRKKLTVISWMAVIVMAAFEALITNSQATNGHELADLQNRQATLTTQIGSLQQQIATTGSLQTWTVMSLRAASASEKRW